METEDGSVKSTPAAEKPSSSSSSSLALFSALGIAPTSDASEIRAAFAAAARRHHPDKGGDAREFSRVSAAYEELMKGRGGGERGFFGVGGNGGDASCPPFPPPPASSSSSTLSRHASVARTAAASLASGPPVAAEVDLDECERFSEEEEEEQEQEEGEGEGDDETRKKTTAKEKRRRRLYYSHPCRCGGSFLVAEEDLPADCSEAVVPCDGCSSRIRVLYRLAE